MAIDRISPIDQMDWKTTLTTETLALGYLNKVFYDETQADFASTLVEENLFADWPITASDPHTKIGLDHMQAFCQGWDEEQLGNLRRDYADLFIGPGHLKAPPGESVYLSTDHIIFEKQTLAVRQFYARFDLQAPRLYQEPDDHFGLEIAFLVHLCSLGLAAIEQGDSDQLENTLMAQREFLEEHLLRWAHLFLGQVIKHAQTDYYRGAAYLGLGSLTQAAASLGLSTKHWELPA